MHTLILYPQVVQKSIKKEGDSVNREHYSINGIANETMKTSLKNSLEKIEGVNKVCVDSGRSTVEVIYNSPATKQEIESCIEESGRSIL